MGNQRLCGGYAEAMWRLCGDYVEAMWRLCGGYVEAMRRLCGGYVETMWRLCGGYAEAMWRLCPAYSFPFPFPFPFPSPFPYTKLTLKIYTNVYNNQNSLLYTNSSKMTSPVNNTNISNVDNNHPLKNKNSNSITLTISMSCDTFWKYQTPITLHRNQFSIKYTSPFL